MCCGYLKFWLIYDMSPGKILCNRQSELAFHKPVNVSVFLVGGSLVGGYVVVCSTSAGAFH